MPTKVPFAGSSTYKDSYPQHPVCPHHGPVELKWAPSSIPFSGTSGSTGEAPVRARIPFEGQSSYKSDYVPHQLCPLHAPGDAGAAAAAYRPSTVPFEGTSTSKEAYQKWDLPARPAYDAAAAYPPRSQIPFEGKTTAQETYTPKTIEARSAPPPYQYRPSSVPFSGTSEVRDQYKQWELPRRDALPAGTGYESRPHIPFEGSSTARSDYTPKAIDRSAFPAAPAGYGYQPSSIPFAGESESQAAYQKWELPAREVGDDRAPPRSAPHIPFEGRSASSEAYTPKALPARPAAQPYEYRPSTVPFDGTTESKEQYKRWELAQATGAPVGYPAHERAHIPFEGRTTSQETYTPKALPHAAPQAGLDMEYKPMPDCRDFATESSAAHGWKQPAEVCPASLLPPAPLTNRGPHVMWDPVNRRWLHNHA